MPMALLGALIAQPARGLLNDVYCQIAMVMLIGLASKHGIRIVEFAEQLRDKGLSINEAAVQAAKIRLPPHPDDGLPSSLTFCPRFSPLVQDQPVETPSEQPYFRGVIVCPVLNLFFIPLLYVIVKWVLEGNKPAMESTPQT
ncbi:MAG TPA: efflux RND transporter permease subunit [Terriglobales bacterium]